MKKIPYGRKLRSDNCVSMINCDRDEKFMMRKCATYLNLLLESYNLIDSETFDLLNWVLGPNMEKIRGYILSRLDETQREKFEEELLDSKFDERSYSSAAKKIMQSPKKKGFSELNGFIQSVLRSRIRKLTYKGASGIEKNLSLFKKMFNLTEQETEFALFFFVIDVCDPSTNFFDLYLHCDMFIGRKYLATLLQSSQRELNQILNGTLSRIDFFEMDQFIKLSSEYRSIFQNPSGETFSKNFFTRILQKAIPLESHLIDWRHTEHILKLLGKKPETSTHIVFYGPPGTGKTSYAHGLVQKLGLPAYEVVRDEENTTIKRRAAVTASLNMTNHGEGSLIVVDEADNMLNTRLSFFSRGETQDKGWLNRILEEPGARTIWITNSIDNIEESVLRRFAFSLYFKPFNRRQRIGLWKSVIRVNRIKRYFSELDIDDLAKRYKVSAGAIDLAIKKAKESGNLSKDGFKEAFVMTLEAHGILINGGKKKIHKDRIEENYSIDGLNIEGDLETTMAQLESFDHYLRKPDNDSIKNMNLLFYGPPGTGKSELARYIANHLDREIITKRASDLLDKYVGETEHNIRKAFEEAENEEAVLIVDEVDTMLFSRNNAQRSWEISQTNEFLTQMERYRGILICTTNRLKGLDEASTRRFNHKIGFKFLTPEGNVIFYQKLLAPLTNTRMDEQNERLLMNITDLAPGDFRIVRDRFSFYAKEQVSHPILIDALEAEVKAKNFPKYGGEKIGF
ncbi:MAG: ATP-binding protein [Deltaproteobacteria bacterium]|nr:ATP-binding protein [Deltaproteobacteria bacterium]